jgi:hypothetical protein
MPRGDKERPLQKGQSCLHQVQAQQSQLGDVPREKRLTKGLQEGFNKVFTPCRQGWMQTNSFGCRITSFFYELSVK